MSDYTSEVAGARAQYGTPLGVENAWNVINAVAWKHRDEGWGLLRKTSGTQWNGCSIDVLINPITREAVDCLGSSEEQGWPQWNEIQYGADFDVRFVAPVNPNPEPPIPPEPPTPPMSDVEARLARIETTLHNLYRALDIW